jgi:hypothetical protein
MLSSAEVPRLASFRLGLRCSRVLPLALLATCACTQTQIDDGPSVLLRQVPPSSANRALAFDGIDDYATTGTAQFPPGTKPQTLSVRFQVEAIGGKHALITLRKDRDSGVELGLREGLLGAWRVYGNRTLALATTPVSTGQWHHAAYTFDMFTVQLYLDGALVASSTNSPDERTPTTCWLGTLDGVNDLFQGNLDDFRIFKSARTAEEIANEAAGKSSSSDSGLVLDLPCDEDSGTVLYDHSPLANDGELGDGVDQRMPQRVSSGAPSAAN